MIHYGPKAAIEKSSILNNAVNYLLPLLLDGEIKPIIGSTFAFDDVLLVRNHLKTWNIGGVIIL